MEKSKYIDHTVLKATTTKEDVKKICLEAKEYDFKSVCINPSHIKYAKELLNGTSVLVCTVIGFPLGANLIETKVCEAKQAIKLGADEIDMVLNIGALIEGDYELVLEELKALREATEGKTLKVIFETCYLTKEQIVKATELSVLAKVDFVKTSTGFGTGGATTEDVELMYNTAAGACEVKASGGVRNLEDFNNMIKAGATRIGASSGVEIMKGEEASADY